MFKLVNIYKTRVMDKLMTRLYPFSRDKVLTWILLI